MFGASHLWGLAIVSEMQLVLPDAKGSGAQHLVHRHLSRSGRRVFWSSPRISGQAQSMREYWAMWTSFTVVSLSCDFGHVHLVSALAGSGRRKRRSLLLPGTTESVSESALHSISNFSRVWIDQTGRIINV